MAKILASLKGEVDGGCRMRLWWFPGHGSLTTIGDERELNPYLQD